MDDVMDRAYHALWTDEEQERIDRDIENNRKSVANIKLEGVPAGVEVEVELEKHGFFFGAHLFNYDQLGTDERNRRYKALFGHLFNSATLPFYWKSLEPEEGRPRFEAEYRDSADYWNTVKNPAAEPHWRRPATDPLVAFGESKGLRLHGHPLTWGSATWHYPEWLVRKLPSPYGERVRPIQSSQEGHNYMDGWFDGFSTEQLERLFPDFINDVNTAFARRIMEIALRYRGRIHSWDVVNESATDFARGLHRPGDGLCPSGYGLLPGDYAYRSFKIADAVFPKDVQLNINEAMLEQAYVDQVADLRARGCKVDVVGAQMHLFDPQICQDIADGKSTRQSPSEVRSTMARLSRAGLPIHLSEITLTSPTPDARGQAIQATIARNLYRLWFSMESMNGITWWNVVDDCGAPGESSVSGLFTRDMEPKRAFFALDELIRKTWTTKIRVEVDAVGRVRFRGFRGTYRLAWTNAAGQPETQRFELR